VASDERKQDCSADLDIEGFIARSNRSLRKGFYEKRSLDQPNSFAQIAHVWSTYESRHNADDPERSCAD